jgi:hypothetical protein
MKIIKSRTIEINPKATSSGCTYYDMESEDEAYIYRWMNRYLADMAEICTYEEAFKQDFFKRRPGLFPKGRNGPNSIASMLGGICSAKLQNPAKNLSDAQLDAVEYIMDQISDLYSEDEEKPKSVKFVKKLFSIVKPVVKEAKKA